MVQPEQLCKMGCQRPVPPGQDRICSICYGDPAWGTDGYLQAQLDAQRKVVLEQEEERDRVMEGEKLATRYEPGV